MSRRKWLHLDGSLDPSWSEDMNTLLDDNKKLCLNSGEIIAMPSDMHVIFEALDVLRATPASITRNGIVYFDSSSLK